MNFTEQDRTTQTIHKWRQPIEHKVLYFQNSINCESFCIGAADFSFWYNSKSDKEVDLQALYGVTECRAIFSDDEEGHFYIVINKIDYKVGYFMIQFEHNDPQNFINSTMHNAKLLVGDVSFSILRGKDHISGKYYKELVIGYKSVHINTYVVQIVDLSQIEDNKTQFKHESFQLWESSIYGFVLSKNKQFVSLSKQGINVLSLGSVEQTKIVDSTG